MNRTDDLDTVTGDYPSLEPLTKHIRSLHDAVSRQGSEVQSVKNDLESRRRQEATKVHFDAIRKVHPDLDAINASDDFQGWLTRQSPLIQRAAAEGNADEVIDVLNRYKVAIGGARSTKTPKFTRAQIAAMSPKEFEEKEAAIDQAVASGEVT